MIPYTHSVKHTGETVLRSHRDPSFGDRIKGLWRRAGEPSFNGEYRLLEPLTFRKYPTLLGCMPVLVCPFRGLNRKVVNFGGNVPIDGKVELRYRHLSRMLDYNNTPVSASAEGDAIVLSPRIKQSRLPATVVSG